MIDGSKNTYYLCLTHSLRAKRTQTHFSFKTLQHTKTKQQATTSKLLLPLHLIFLLAYPQYINALSIGSSLVAVVLLCVKREDYLWGNLLKVSNFKCNYLVPYDLLLVLEYFCWYTANIVTISVFNALSIGSSLVSAVLRCVKRDDI